MKTKVGQVTIEEKDEIQSLFERKNGLKELFQILQPDNETLYQKLIADMGKTSTEFQNWWSQMSEKYNWEKSKNGRWEIDFDTCEIFLVE